MCRRTHKSPILYAFNKNKPEQPEGREFISTPETAKICTLETPDHSKQLLPRTTTSAVAGIDKYSTKAESQEFVNVHAVDAVKHVTAAERTAWNAKAQKGDKGEIGPVGPTGAVGPAGAKGDPASVNGKSGSNIILTAADVGALATTGGTLTNGVLNSCRAMPEYTLRHTLSEEWKRSVHIYPPTDSGENSLIEIIWDTSAQLGVPICSVELAASIFKDRDFTAAEIDSLKATVNETVGYFVSVFPEKVSNTTIAALPKVELEKITATLWEIFSRGLRIVGIPIDATGSVNGVKLDPRTAFLDLQLLESDNRVASMGYVDDADKTKAPLDSPSFSGTPTAAANSNYTTYQLRNAALLTSAPSSLANGAIAFVYS